MRIKKFISLFFSCVLVVSLMPTFTAFADTSGAVTSGDDTTKSTETFETDTNISDGTTGVHQGDSLGESSQSDSEGSGTPSGESGGSASGSNETDASDDTTERNTVELTAIKLDSSDKADTLLKCYNELRGVEINDENIQIDRQIENENSDIKLEIQNNDGYAINLTVEQESEADLVFVETVSGFYTMEISDRKLLEETDYTAKFDESVKRVSVLKEKSEEELAAIDESPAQANSLQNSSQGSNSAGAATSETPTEELALTKLDSEDEVADLEENYTSVRAKTIDETGTLTDAKVDALNDNIDISIANDANSGEVKVEVQEETSAAVVLVQTADAYYAADVPNGTLTENLSARATLDDEVEQVTVYAQQKKTRALKASVTPKASVSYCAHVQNVGWQDWVKDGKTSGTSGKALRVEGLKIKVDSNLTGSISYSTHVQNVGWQDWVSDGSLAGTTGQSLRVEAVKIKLTGELAQNFDVYYRCHVQNYGWLDWAKNGEAAGSQGLAYRVEAVQVKLVKKGGAAPGSTATPFEQKLVEYSAHVQNVGWQDYVADGETAGTSGQSLRVEALKISLGSGVSGGISYSTHVQNVGWQSYVSNDSIAGTTGRSLQVEAVKIKLTGEAAEKYDVYYRVHVQNLGWLDWASNGAEAGSSGLAYQVEAIQIKLVAKGGAAPGSTSKPYVTPSVSYKVYEQGQGWTSSVKNGAQAGTTGQALPLEGISVSVADLGVTGGVSYSTHIENTGWLSWSSNGKTSGKVGKNLQMEAVKINLTGAAANQFDIYYRCHVANYGWLDWAKNGAPAGSEGQSLAVEAVQIKLVLKGNAAPGSTSKPFINESTSLDSLNITLNQMTSYQSTSLSYSDLKSLLNPNSYSSSSASYYQFADLRGYSGLTAAQLDAYIASTSAGRSGKLKNMGMSFVSAAKTYDINECYLLAHAILESGWGSSELASGYSYNGSTYYNFYGIGAYDSSPLSGGRAMAVNNGWTSPSKAISGAASWINSNYTRRSEYPQPTLYGMKWDYLRSSDTYARGWHQYATDPYWATSIATIMSNCYSYNNYDPVLDYIIPKYK